MEDLADRVIPHYERHAHAWDADRRRGNWNDKPWHDRFVRALPMGASVLDKDGKPADAAKHNTCAPCHEPASAKDFVFTNYAP